MAEIDDDRRREKRDNGSHEAGESRGLGGRVRRAVQAVDEAQSDRRWLAIPVAVVKKFGDDRAGSLAALIAYYGFFSVFPLLLVLVTVLGFALGPGSHTAQRVLSQFPIIGTDVGSGSLQGSAMALVVGIVGSLWAGTGVMSAMQNAMNRVWNVPLKDTPNTLKQLGRSFAMLGVFGGAMVATSILSGFGGGGSTGMALRILGIAAGLVINVGLYLFAFRVLTVQDVAWRTALPGAVVGGVWWTVLQVFGGLYVAHQINGASQTYGTFAVVIGLLSWLYLAAQGSLFAAELNVVLARRLWPRRLVQPPLSDADREALVAYGKEQQRRPEERVHVSFTGQAGSEGARSAPTDERPGRLS